MDENQKMYLVIALAVILLVGVFLHAAIYKPSQSEHGEETETEEGEGPSEAVEPGLDAPVSDSVP
ncbi:hypothetical protein HY571_01625 [Candidatus Micrarchaeota archaeon]|nr:hypothetical protein [Candidatus Micrarchaeota archaeon]